MHAYQGIAFRTAYLLTGIAAEGRDAAQDAFVKACALGRFRKVRSCARGSPADRRQRGPRTDRRSAGRRTHLALRARRAALGGRGPRPEANLIASEQQEGLLAAVNALPEEQREVVACRYFLGCRRRRPLRRWGSGRAPSSHARAGSTVAGRGAGR